MTLGALRFPTFNPAMATIIAVQRAPDFTIVQTAFDNTFIEGLYIKFLIPEEYGMTQLNGLTGLIVNIDLPDLFTVNIDSINFDAFVVPAIPLQSAQAIPTGELATQFLGANVNILGNKEYPPYPNPSPSP